MKKCILSFLLVMAILAGNAQAYFGGGMNVSFVDNDALDQIVYEYNRSRSWLTTPMEDVKLMRGGQATFGWIGERGFTFDLTWVGRHAKVFAEGIPDTFTNELVRREVKVRNNSFNMGMGWTWHKGIIRPGFLFSFDFGNIRSFTRAGAAAVVDDLEYTALQKDLQVMISLSVPILIRFGYKSPVGLQLRPYYQFQFLDGDFSQLNQTINQNTYSNVVTTAAANGHFGVQASLVFVIGDKESKPNNYSYTPEPTYKPKPDRGDMKRGSGGGR